MHRITNRIYNRTLLISSWLLIPYDISQFMQAQKTFIFIFSFIINHFVFKTVVMWRLTCLSESMLQFFCLVCFNHLSSFNHTKRKRFWISLIHYWKVSLILYLCVIIRENHIQAAFLYRTITQICTNGTLGLGDADISVSDILIILPRISDIFWRVFRFSSIGEHIQYISIFITVISITFWPNLSPMRWLSLHDGWLGNAIKIDCLTLANNSQSQKNGFHLLKNFII